VHYLDRIFILNILKSDRIFNRTVENRDRVIEMQNFSLPLQERASVAELTIR
jgi:hypothetical protein